MIQKTTANTPMAHLRTTLLAAMAMASSAWAADIQSVTGMQRDGREVVQISLNEPLNFEPVVFTVQSPARISLDFPGVGLVEGRQTVGVNQGNLRTINVVDAGDRARIVLNLREATTYRLESVGNNLLVHLDSPGSATAATSQPTASRIAVPSTHTTAVAPSLASAPAPNTLQGIDFRRSLDGSGRVVVDLPSASSSVNLRVEGRKIVLDVQDAQLPAELRKRFDVTDFGTPINSIVATQAGNATRLEIEARNEWVYSAYQTDSQYVLEVREVVPDPTKLTQGTGFTGEKLSLNFQSIEIRSLLQVIADFTKFNIVTSDTVQGSLTLRLEDVPWDQALQIILDSKGLGYERNGNVLWVAPREEIDTRKQKEYEAARALEQLEPLRTQSFQLNYARSETLAAQLAASGGSGGGSGGTQNSNRFLSNRGSAIAEPRTNQLFITDTPSKLEEVARLIASWDIPVRQVLIEARIVEASDSFGRSLGVRLGGADLRANRGGDGGYSVGGNNRVVFGSSYANAVASSGAGGTTSATQQFVNLPAALSAGEAATFALSIFNSAANRFLNLELSALESSGEGRVISSPRIVTADQVKATIEQGTELPYAATSPNGATTVEFKQAVMKLEVTPQITPEGNVILDLLVNKDSPNYAQSTSGGIAVDTKRVTTQVLVENGGTIVIGGIFELQESNSVTKVPFFGDLPVAGHLFRTKTRETSKSELLVFITPKIVTDQNTLR